VFRRLLPDSATGLSPADVVRDLELASLAPADRPYLVVNMAATADGRVAIGGRSAPVAGPADRELFHELRAQGDAVMAGAGTVRVERYRPFRKPALAVLVSGSLDLPADLPILQDPGSRVVIVTQSPDSLPEAAASVSYLRTDLASAMRALRFEYGVRSIVCEGGPHLNDSLLREGLVDELFLCVSPKLAGDSSQPAGVEGLALPEPVELSLISLHEAEEHVFLRYRVSSRTGRSRAPQQPALEEGRRP
jgi:5-amino-6-(5-phosphoribosylamino)uracil reductase